MNSSGGGKSGGNIKDTLLSPFDKPFLTNVFDNVEAVADCLGAIFIAQQPKKKEKGNSGLDMQAGGDYIHLCFILLFKNDAAVLLVFFSTHSVQG